MSDILVDTDLFVDHLRGASELKLVRHRLHYAATALEGRLALATRNRKHFDNVRGVRVRSL